MIDFFILAPFLVFERNWNSFCKTHSLGIDLRETKVEVSASFHIVCEKKRPIALKHYIKTRLRISFLNFIIVILPGGLISTINQNSHQNHPFPIYFLKQLSPLFL